MLAFGRFPDGTKAQFQYQQGMLQQKAAQARTGGKALLQLEQQRFNGGTLRVSSPARPGGISGWFGHHTSVEESEEGTIALDQGIMLNHLGQDLLVKYLRVWYQDNKLLVA